MLSVSSPSSTTRVPAAALTHTRTACLSPTARLSLPRVVERLLQQDEATTTTATSRENEERGE